MKNYGHIGVIACIFFYLLALAPCHAQPGDKHKNLTDFSCLKFPTFSPPPPIQYKSINHADAVDYQDIKRGVFYLSKDLLHNIRRATGFLVNTASQNKKPYMITTASFFTEDDKKTIGKKDQFIDIRIHVNSEVPNAENGNISRALRARWPTKIKLLVLHRETDIALFEVLDPDGEPKKTGTEAAYKGLYNAYALGWDIGAAPADPDLLRQYISANITIPKNSYKSIFLNPQSAKLQEHNNAASPIGFKAGEAYTVNWGVSPVPKEGVHGSPLFNEQDQAIGLHSGPGLNWDKNPPKKLTNRFLYTALQNSWNYQEKKTDDKGNITQPAGLIDYLDPDRTYVTNIPGGYWADLKAFPKATPPRSIPDVFSFDVAANTDRIEINKDYPLFFTDIQNLIPRDGVFRRPFGIRVNGELSGNQSVYLYATKNIINEAGTNKEHLVWALQARDAADRNPRFANDPNQLGDPFGLRELGFYGSEVEFAFANSKFIINQNTADTDFNKLRTFDLNSMADGKAFSNTFFKIYENNLNNIVSLTKTSLAVNLYLSQTNDFGDPIPVVAVAMPGDPPENLNQLMNPNVVQNAFKANEYQLLEVYRDPQTPAVYLDHFNVFQTGIGSYSKLKIIGSNSATKGKYHSGDNGGYLNMVNPLTYIDDIECSYIHIDDNNNLITKENKIQLFFNTPASCNTQACKYKVWIDYSQDHRYSGDYTGGVQPVPELIVEGTILQGDAHRKKYRVKYEVPNEQDLDIAAGKKKAYRMRVAVSTADIPDQPNPPANATDPLTPWEMNNGEVEDYLIVFKALSNDEKEAEAKGSKRKIATNNKVAKRAKKSDHTTDKDSDNSDDSEFERFVNNLGSIFPDTDDNNANNLALAISLVDVGQSPTVSNFLIIKMGDILSLAYQHLVGGWGDNDPNNPDDDDPKPGESCSGDPLNDDDDQNQNPLNYDPTDPEAWEYWTKFNSLYNNVVRIINFWNNLTIYEGGVPVPFIVNDSESYALWNAFVGAYNVLAHFKNANNAIDFTQYYDSDGNFDHDAWNSAVSSAYNALNGIDTLYDLLLLVYNNDALLETAASKFSVDVNIFKSLFSYILKFQCFKQQLIEDANEGRLKLDFSKTSSKIMLDAQGETVSESSENRETENNFTLTKLPGQDELGVVYQAKDDGVHEVIVGVNSNGNMLYYLKNDDETKSITSTTTWGIGEDASIINRFAGVDANGNNGKIELEIEIDGNSELSSTEGIQATEFGFIPEQFKKLSNGARVGAPLANETNTEVTIAGVSYKLVPINARWNSTFYNSFKDTEGEDPELRKQLLNYTKGANTTEAGNQGHTDSTGTFRIFPNPTDGDLHIEITAGYGESIAITIFDLAGRLVYEKEETSTKQGQQKLTLDDIKLVAGQYVVKVTASKVTQSEIVTFE